MAFSEKSSAAALSHVPHRVWNSSPATTKICAVNDSTNEYMFVSAYEAFKLPAPLKGGASLSTSAVCDRGEGLHHGGSCELFGYTPFSSADERYQLKGDNVLAVEVDSPGAMIPPFGSLV